MLGGVQFVVNRGFSPVIAVSRGCFQSLYLNPRRVYTGTRAMDKTKAAKAINPMRDSDVSSRSWMKFMVGRKSNMLCSCYFIISVARARRARLQGEDGGTP
jgi:hypothetical protein